MDKKSFVEQYVLAFMANYNSNKYFNFRAKLQPCEDVNKIAIESAELEWENLTKLGLYLSEKELDKKNLIESFKKLYSFYKRIKQLNSKRFQDVSFETVEKNCEYVINQVSYEMIGGLSLNVIVSLFNVLNRHFSDFLEIDDSDLSKYYLECQNLYDKVIRNQ